jgi:hypothetical protein
MSVAQFFDNRTQPRSRLGVRRNRIDLPAAVQSSRSIHPSDHQCLAKARARDEAIPWQKYLRFTRSMRSKSHRTSAYTTIVMPAPRVVTYHVMNGAKERVVTASAITVRSYSYSDGAHDRGGRETSGHGTCYVRAWSRNGCSCTLSSVFANKSHVSRAIGTIMLRFTLAIRPVESTGWSPASLSKMAVRWNAS